MNDKGNDHSKRIEEIFHELCECREDERSSHNQLMQIIMAVGTVIGVIFGLSNAPAFSDSAIYLFYLSVFALCIAISYAITLGIMDTLRFHYMQGLEDQLGRLIPRQSDEEEFMHWISFSTPVTTKNIFHLKSKYSLIHFIFFVGSFVFLILFCGTLTWLQYQKLAPQSGEAIIVMIGGSVFIGSFLVFLFFALKSKKLFHFAMEASKIKKVIRNEERNKEKKRKEQYDHTSVKYLKKMNVKLKKHKIENDKTENRKGGYSGKGKSVLTTILYFLYPKAKDLQKLFVIGAGFLTGLCLQNGTNIPQITAIQWKDFIYTLIIVDFLICQARFQLNDIRGLAEDDEYEGKYRLPAEAMGIKTAVITSLMIMFLRVALAAYLISFQDAEIRKTLWICLITIIILTIAYEAARTKNNGVCVLLLVNIGYPLRFYAGICAALPGIWTSGSALFGSTVSLTGVILLLLAAYFCMGGYSVYLFWTHDALKKESGGADAKKHFQKKHYRILFNVVKDRYETAQLNGSAQPLKAKGKLRDWWNLAYLSSMVFLFLIILWPAPFSLSISVLIIELLLIGTIILTCLSKQKKIVFYTVLSLLLILVKLIISGLYFEEYLYYLCICANQMLFVITYFALRYLFNSDYHFVTVCVQIITRLLYLLIGKSTWDYLKNSDKKSARD